MNLAHNLFLLLFNLSNLNSKKTILQLFIEGINELVENVEFEHLLLIKNKTDNIIAITNNKSSFGYLKVNNSEMLYPEERKLVENSAIMLAGILYRLELQEFLEQKIEEIEDLYETKSAKLEESNRDLDAARIASLNLVEDMEEEVEKRRNTESKLRLSEQKFKAIVKESPLGIFYFDNAGEIIECNSSLAKIVGSKQSSIIGLNMYKSLKDKALIEAVKKTLSHGHAYYEDLYTSVNAKKTTYIRVIFSGIRNNKNKIIAGIGLAEDIGVRKKTELLLHNQQTLLENIIEGTNAGTWDWNIKTGELILNERWAEIMGYTLKELKPININLWRNSVNPLDVEATNKKLEDHFNQKTDYYNVIFRQPHKNGNWVWVNARGKVTVRDKNGKPLSMSGIHLDITQLKEAELKLQEQNEELETMNEEMESSMEKTRSINNQLEIALDKAKESDRLKNAFLANMSHEIRTPMNGILGFVKLLERPNLSEKDLSKYLDVINKSGKRMLNTINDLMDISRIEAKQIELYPDEADLNIMLNDLFIFFDQEAQAKGLELRQTYKLIEKDSLITTDSEKVNAILINLIKNSIKYTHEGIVDFGCTLKEDTLKFYVKDTGIGIPKDRQQAIFDRFVQADIEDTQVYEGTGLGLSISQAYVELLGGKIWLESTEGEGSTFYFTIPYVKSNEAIAEDEQLFEIAALNDLKKLKKKILIVEDEEISDNLLSIILKDYSNNIIHAKNGIEAIELCKKHNDIDLIFMDIRMPQLGGYQATREIRKFNKKVKIIAQTAYALSGDREKAIAAGCNDYISKPIMADQFKLLINKYLYDIE